MGVTIGMTGNAGWSVPPPIPVVWGVLEAELLPQSARFSEMKREIEFFKICFNISMENILPEEKPLRTAIYTAFRNNTTEFCEFLLQLRISKHTSQDLTSHLPPVCRAWQKSLDKGGVFSLK